MRGQHGQVIEVEIREVFPGVRIRIGNTETMILEPGLRGPALHIPREEPEQYHIHRLSLGTLMQTHEDLNFNL